MTSAEARRNIRMARGMIENISIDARMQKHWTGYHHQRLMELISEMEQASDKLAEAQYEAGRMEQSLFGGGS